MWKCGREATIWATASKKKCSEGDKQDHQAKASASWAPDQSSAWSLTQMSQQGMLKPITMVKKHWPSTVHPIV